MAAGSTLRRRAREFARQHQAFKLVCDGLSYARVAASPWPCTDHDDDGIDAEHANPDCPRCHLYHDARGAHRAVQRYMQTERELTTNRKEELRERQLARLDRMWEGLSAALQSGDTDAVRAAVRLAEREARLMGLDAPTKVQVSDELDGEIEALMAQLAGKDDQRQEA